MAQQILDTVGNTDTLKLGGQKINANFTELYGIALTAVQNAVLGQANGVATLDANGKVPAGQISALSTTEVFPVASEAAMLALPAANTGDVAVRSDLVGSASGNTFMLNGTASILADWVSLDTGHVTLPSQIGAEPALGNPVQDGMALVSSAAGVRSFKTIGTAWNERRIAGSTAAGEGVFANTAVTPGTGTVQLHMNGTQASTTFTDNGTSGLTWTASGATIDTFSQRFGGASAKFLAADYISTPANAAFDFGSAGFTIDFQINPTALAAQDIMGQMPATGATDAAWTVGLDATGHVVFRAYVAGTPVTMTSTFVLTAGTYQHVAITRVGSNLYFFLNGAIDNATGNAGLLNNAIDPSAALPMLIGTAGITANTGFAGNLDELRIYKGAGFWSQNFSPLTTAQADGVAVIGGAFALSLPATPVLGDTVSFVDSGGYWNINNLTITSASNIQGVNTNFIADVQYASFSLIYTGTTGWIVL